MMLDSSTLTPLLKKLEKKGLITREKSTKDERNLNITITEKGLTLEKELQKVRRKMKKICNMTPEEVEEMQPLLYKLLDTIIEENKKNIQSN